MASPLEQAVIELQILVRQLRQRLAALEWRSGRGGAEVGEPVGTRGAAGSAEREQRESGGGRGQGVREVVTEGVREGVPVRGEVVGSEDAVGKEDLVGKEGPAEKRVAAEIPEGEAATAHAVAEEIAEAERDMAEAKEAAKARLTTPVTAPPPPGPGPEDVYQPAEEREQARAAARAELEKTIGETVTTWAGTLVLIAGMLFFVESAWKENWLTPLARIWLTVLDGALIVGMGQWLGWRRMRGIEGGYGGGLGATVALAGVGVMMAGVCAGNVALSVPEMTYGQCLGVLLAIGVVGLGVAWRMGYEAVAVGTVLGLLGAPAILGDAARGDGRLPGYVLAVTLLALAMRWAQRRWLAVRTAAFIGAWTWMIIWAQMPAAREHKVGGMAAMGAVFVLFLLEIGTVLPVLREIEVEAVPPRLQGVVRPMLAEGIAAWFFVINTAAAMTAFWIFFVTLGLGGVAWVALLLAGVVLIFGAVVRTEQIAEAAVMQAVGLVALAIPLFFTQTAVTAGWAVLALALGVFDRMRNSWIARGLMVGVVALLTGRILLVDSVNPALQGALFTFRQSAVAARGMPGAMIWQAVSGWMVITWGAAVLMLVLGWLTRERDVKVAGGAVVGGAVARSGAVWATVACLVAGTILVTGLVIGKLEPHGPATLALVLWVMAVIGFCRLRSMGAGEGQIETLAAAALMILTIKWAVVDAFTAAAAWENRGSPWASVPFFNLFFLTGVLLIGAVLLSRGIREAGKGLMGWWATAIAFVAVDVELLHCIDYALGAGNRGAADIWIMQSAALSLLWGAWGCATVMIGLWRRRAAMRWVGLVMLAVTVAKVLVVDMASSERMMRVLSFVVVGGVLLVVSYAYHKAGLRTGAEEVEAEGGAAAAGVGGGGEIE